MGHSLKLKDVFFAPVIFFSVEINLGIFVRRPKQENGNISLIISANLVRNPRGGLKVLGLPFRVKPRLLMSKIQIEAIRNKSPVIPIENSMSGLMKELGMKVTGAISGTINGFKKQAARLPACHFRTTTNFQDKGGIRQKIQSSK